MELTINERIDNNVEVIQKVRLKHIVKISKGKKSTEVSSSNLRYIQIVDLRNDDNLKYAEQNKSNVLCTKNDILIAWDGANAGTIGYNLEGAVGSTLAKLVINDNYKIFPNFLGRFLQTKSKSLRDSCTGATIPHISKSELENLEIPFPTLPTQKKITKILDTADQLRQYNKQLIEKYDALTQSLFLNMFGDPVNNEKGWEKKKLGHLGAFKNGLNYTKSQNGQIVKILGVGDFKNYWKISDYNNLSTIEIESFPSKDFLLEDGDLIFVRSNGNKDLVGRCLIAYPNGEKVTYSGFCIRFRKNNSHLSEMYLVQLMRNKLFKKYIFKNGRGANIQNINQELLSNIEIQLPPLNLQNQFAERVEMIETQKRQAQETLAKSENLFQSLLQQAFKGELL